MRFFERKLTIGLLFISLPLLFLPKINLISLESETAGLRIDDLVLFVIGALLIWSHALSNQRLYQVEGWILLLTGFSIISFLSNRLLVSYGILYMDAKIFYTIRILEYFIFFYMGILASQYFSSHSLIRIFFLWNLGLMILQKFNLAGAVTVEGYNTDVSTRVQGIASFPSEMGLLLNLIFCYMIHNESTQSRIVNLIPSAFIRHILRKFYLFWMFSLFGIFVIFTGNRISIVALFICFFCKLCQEFSFRSIGSVLFAILLTPILISGVAYLITQTAAVYERSIDLFSFKNLELASIVWDNIDMTKNPMGNEVTSSDNYDVSWWLRIHKWTYALKAYFSNPECYLQGVGPGFCWAALDGGFFRIFTEYGIIGSFLFYKFFSCLYRLNSQTKWMIIAFMLNMIFFDAYLAYKTMSFLFFACGCVFEKQKREAKNQAKQNAMIKQLTGLNQPLLSKI